MKLLLLLAALSINALPAPQAHIPRNQIGQLPFIDGATETRLYPKTIPHAYNTDEIPSAPLEGNPSYYGNDAWNDHPVATRGNKGGSVLGPQNKNLDRMNADSLAPPSTDHGKVPNAKWPYGNSHNRLSDGGWARQQNQQVLPIATEMAGVNMRLEKNAIRELHWHRASEWSYMIAGSAIVTAVDPQGRNFIEEVHQGDLWYFPAGVPHSIQAIGDEPNGCEFILVFDDGKFDENETFLLTDWLARVPKNVLRKSFGFSDASKAFDKIPGEELYIFRGSEAATVAQQKIKSPHGVVPEPYVHKFSTQEKMHFDGGWVKIADSTNFKVSKTIAAAEVMLHPGAIRELHWHPDADEWDLYLSGTTRVGVFIGSGNAHTFNFEAGDVGYWKQQNGHYVECLGPEPCRFLECLNTDKYSDVSLSQWLALTPVQLVADHLRVSNETIEKFSKEKPVLRSGSVEIS